MSAATHDLLRLLAGVGGVLIIATLVGHWLRSRQPADQPSPTIDNLNSRINAWWAMCFLLGLAFLGGRTGVVILFAVCSFAALREFLPLQYWFVWNSWYGLYSIFIPVYAFLILPIFAVMKGSTENYLVRVAETQWALMIAVFCASHVPALLTLNIPDYAGRNVLLIAWLVVVVQSSDVLQYVWGKLAGKHLVAPTLSPSKTVEGAIGGIASATLLGTALWWITPFMGFLGGLVLSAVKRDRGVKDWGHLIAGHGGFIDRLDSVLFSAPVFFHLVRYGWDLH